MLNAITMHRISLLTWLSMVVPMAHAQAAKAPLSQISPSEPAAVSAPVTSASLPLGASAPLSESDELAALQSQIPILKARAEIAEYQAAIKKAEAQQAGAQLTPAPGQATSLQGRLPIAVARVMSEQTEPMLVLAIRAYNGIYEAQLDLNGQPIVVRAGNTLDGGWKVTRIDDSSVRLERGRHIRILGL